MRKFRPAFLVLLMAAGCGSLRNFSIFTTEQEVELGRRVSEELEAEVELLDDPAIVGYVQAIGAKVAARAWRQDITYEFKVIDDPEQANAFAIPGGHIYIFTGLLIRMDSEMELAAVLGHEAAHIAERHSMEALTRQVGLNLILAALTGEEAAAWQELLADVGTTLAFAKFSRQDEKEADELGLIFMYSAGYDPQGMVDLLELFVELAERELSVIELWLSSHPGTKQRVKMVKDLIREFNLYGGKTGKTEYLAVMKKLKAEGAPRRRVRPQPRPRP